MLETIARSRFTAPALALGFAIFYLPSIGFGYRGNDFPLLTTDWAAFLDEPFAVAGRPLLSLSCVRIPTFAALDGVVASSQFQHALNIGLFLAVVLAAVALARRRRFPPVALLFLVAALCHPSFLWAVTWISQRSDLFLVLCLCLSLSSLGGGSPGPVRPGSIAWLTLASASKSPFLFQNLAFAVAYARKRQYGFAALSLISMGIFLYFGYATYYATAVAGGGHGLFLLESGSDRYFATIALFRSIKILEGVFYTFVPLSAYALSAAWVLGVGSVVIACWVAILVDLWRGPVGLGDLRRDPNFALVASIGLLLCVPYAFSSGLRIYVPATLFLYLAVGIAVGLRGHPGTRTVAGISIIAVIHLAGVWLNYPASRTDCFELDRRHEARCQGTSVPAEDWNRFRGEMVDRFVIDVLR